jgi:hypothetical protein
MAKFRLDYRMVDGEKYVPFDSPPTLYEADDVYERIRVCSFRASAHVVRITRIDDNVETVIYDHQASTHDVLEWLSEHDLNAGGNEMDALLASIEHLP